MLPLEKAMVRARVIIAARVCENCIHKDCSGTHDCVVSGSGFHSHWIGDKEINHELEFITKNKDHYTNQEFEYLMEYFNDR